MYRTAVVAVAEKQAATRAQFVVEYAFVTERGTTEEVVFHYDTIFVNCKEVRLL